MTRIENIADHRWILGVGDVAQLLELSPGTVRRLADNGAMPCQRTPSGHRRFRRVDVDAYLERRST